jgi:hypothetical protein
MGLETRIHRVEALQRALRAKGWHKKSINGIIDGRLAGIQAMVVVICHRGK